VLSVTETFANFHWPLHCISLIKYEYIYITYKYSRFILGSFLWQQAKKKEKGLEKRGKAKKNELGKSL